MFVGSVSVKIGIPITILENQEMDCFVPSITEVLTFV